MRRFIMAATAAAALFSFPAFAQERSQSSASLPDFSGLWGNPYLYGIETPLSGPGPVVNTSRRRQTLDADGRPLTAAKRCLRLATRFPSTSGTAKHLAIGAGGHKRNGAKSR